MKLIVLILVDFSHLYSISKAVMKKINKLANVQKTSHIINGKCE